MWHNIVRALDVHQGVIAVIAILLTLKFNRPRKWVGKKMKQFVKFLLQDISKNQEEFQEHVKGRMGALETSMSEVKKELTQNGGMGGEKTSTMKDNIGRLLRQQDSTQQTLANLSDNQEKHEKKIDDMGSTLNELMINFARTEGQVELLGSAHTLRGVN